MKEGLLPSQVKLVPSQDSRLEKLCYSIQEVAEVMGLSRTEASYLVHTEGFPAFRHGRRILISRERLAEWVREKADQGLGDRYVRRGV